MDYIQHIHPIIILECHPVFPIQGFPIQALDGSMGENDL
jgi:hypothetical protein